MLEFLVKSLEQGGVVAMLYSFTVLGATSAVVSLWKQNQDLRREIHVAHAQFTDALREAHSEHLAAINALHEKRTGDAQRILGDVVEHIKRADAATQRLAASVETLITTMSGRR